VVPRAPEAIFELLLQNSQTIRDTKFDRLQLPQRQRNKLSNIEAAALQVASRMWAPSTWKDRRNVWARLAEFAHKYQLDLATQMDYTVMLFAESTAATTSPGTRQKYVAQLRTIASRIGINSLPVSTMYSRGLAASGSVIPEK
jgi:hypothetical protein